MHAWHDVSPGNDLPRDFQAVIEIPLGSNVKYELDKASGLSRWTGLFTRRCITRRIMDLSADVAEDDDPLDVLVLCQEAVQPLALIQARAIGIDDHGGFGSERRQSDCGGHQRSRNSTDYVEARDLPPHRLLVLKRFFSIPKHWKANRCRWRTFVQRMQPSR